jgi:short-subunit dehydrogenase
VSRFPLEGKLVLISGASGGIGEALARECARRGARLALASRRLGLLQKLAKELGGRAYALDVGKDASVKRCLAQVRRSQGSPDVLINNAGIHLLSKVEALPLPELEKAFNINVFGPIRLIQACLPGLRKQKGMIVQIGSTLAFRSVEGVGGYAATKGALARLSEALRMELLDEGVHVLDAAPGVVKTALRSNAFHTGAKPAPSASLPFAREASEVAVGIVDAMEARKRDVMPSALPVRFAMRYLNAFFPGFLDKKLRGRN